MSFCNKVVKKVEHGPSAGLWTFTLKGLLYGTKVERFRSGVRHITNGPQNSFDTLFLFNNVNTFKFENRPR